MDPKTAKTIAELHLKLAGEYREAANAACNDHQTWQVYSLVKASMAEETKARQLKLRYLGS